MDDKNKEIIITILNSNVEFFNKISKWAKESAANFRAMEAESQKVVIETKIMLANIEGDLQ